MNRKTLSFLAMIAVVAVPTPGSAGWLGLFKRCHSKPKCVRSYPSPTEQVTGAAPCERQELYSPYTCNVCFETYCEPEEGDPYEDKACGEGTGSTCEDAIWAAYENALENMPEYCEETGTIQSECTPECTGNRACADDCRNWYATYTVRCCNGCVIEKTAKANSCAQAKLTAKVIVFGLARQQCRGPIRCCSSKIWSVEEAATDTAAQ
jgi:hypothetical protein